MLATIQFEITMQSQYIWGYGTFFKTRWYLKYIWFILKLRGNRLFLNIFNIYNILIHYNKKIQTLAFNKKLKLDSVRPLKYGLSLSLGDLTFTWIPTPGLIVISERIFSLLGVKETNKKLAAPSGVWPEEIWKKWFSCSLCIRDYGLEIWGDIVYKFKTFWGFWPSCSHS